MKKGQRKTFIANLVIKSKHPEKLTDFGLGKGVISTEEITFKDNMGRGFDSPLFAMSLVKEGERMISDAVEVKWVEKVVKKGRKK